jgi:hypothetical protein
VVTRLGEVVDDGELEGPSLRLERRAFALVALRSVLADLRSASASSVTVEGMAARRDKVNVDLDAQIVERARAELGAGPESDAAVVERALDAYLLGRLLDTTQSKGGLAEEDAERLAYEELHASRRDRGAA